MKQQTKRLISFMLSLVFLVCAVFTYSLFTREEYDAVLRLRGEQIGGEKFLKEKDTIAEKLANLKAIATGTGAQDIALREAVNRALPSSEEMPNAVAQLYGIAEAQGLAVESLSAISGSAAPVRRGAKVASAEYTLGMISFDMKMTGAYASLKKFLSGLSQNARIFEVKEISIAPAGRPDQDLYRFAVSVIAYYQEVGSANVSAQ